MARTRWPLGFVLALGALTGAILSTAIACTVIVDGQLPKYGPVCQFPGREQGTCGACLAASCQARIDACCASNDCQLLTSNGSKDGKQSVLGSCVANPTRLNPDCVTLLDPDAFHQFEGKGYVEADGYQAENHNIQVCAKENCSALCATSCDFEGASSACGTCVTQACNVELAACCDTLAGTAGDLVGCIQGSKNDCGYLRAPLDGGADAGDCRYDFAKCLVDHCDSPCSAGDAG